MKIPVAYSLAEQRFDPARDVPILHAFAIVDEGEDGITHMVRRTRSNGQTFDLTYSDEFWARRGLTAARLHRPTARLHHHRA